MDDLMDAMKPTLNAMNEMYRVGYKVGFEAGKAEALKGVSKDLDKILEIGKAKE